MVTETQKAAVTEYFDNEEQLGRWVESSEVEDVLRELDGAPKDEEALFLQARDVLLALMEDGVIACYGKRDHPTHMLFKMADR